MWIVVVLVVAALVTCYIRGYLDGEKYGYQAGLLRASRKQYEELQRLQGQQIVLRPSRLLKYKEN
jgi:hypothetical protein